jgi:hypothetical protein
MEKTSISTYILAAIGLLGVLMGSLLTGFFQLQSTKASLEKDLSIESAQGSRQMQSTFVDLASRYMSELQALTAERKVDLSTENGFKRVREFQTLSYKLSLYVSMPTAKKLIEVSAKVHSVYTLEIGSPEREEATDLFIREATKLYIALYSEAARYRLRSTPNAADDEVMLTLFQSLLEDA